VRVLDAIRFFWPPLREEGADLADLVWLQLIKDGSPALYRWIEGYCATAAAISLGVARVENGEKQQKLAELHSTVSAGYFDDFSYRYFFADQLPGLEIDGTRGQTTYNLFKSVSENVRNQAIQKKRLSSPDHYRLYFALIGPSHALTQDNYSFVWSAASDGADRAGVALLDLQDQPAVGAFTKADVLLETLRSGSCSTLVPRQAESFLIAFSQVLDEAYRRHPFDRYWGSSIWDRAQGLLPFLLHRLEPMARTPVVVAMFGKGAAISWLTSVLRRETLAHGRYGNDVVRVSHVLVGGVQLDEAVELGHRRGRREEDWIFDEHELDVVTTVMLDRYRAMSASDVLNCPDPINLLFAWRQAGDEQEPRRLLECATSTDNGLIEALERLTSTVISSDRGTFMVLARKNIAPFLDYDDAKKRVLALGSNETLGARATKLAAKFDDGAEQ
jgi:hypothetical protein